MDRRASTKRDYLEQMLFDESVEPTDLPLSLLEYITDSFSNDKQIGRGGFAVVYKGVLRNGVIAVKKMHNMHLHENKFQQEIECLMKAKHKNIVRFLGYCADTQGKMESYKGKSVLADVRQRLLCFEYLPKGSLHDYITDASRELEWTQYYQIIKGICTGLLYLHENRIVHLDLKPANILLDDNMVPKIADFGLSRCFDEKQSHVITSKLFGSLGYLAPEIHSGIITFKSDIYNLGVILREILTGEKMYPEDYDVLKSWGDRLDKLHREKQLEQLLLCTEIGKECTNYDPKSRPDARTIVRRLDEADIAERSIVTDMSKLSTPQVLKSWGNRLDKLHREKQLEQLLLCTEIGKECTNFDPKSRPDARTIVRRLDEADIAERSIVTDMSKLSTPQLLGNSTSFIASITSIIIALLFKDIILLTLLTLGFATLLFIERYERIRIPST